MNIRRDDRIQETRGCLLVPLIITGALCGLAAGLDFSGGTLFGGVTIMLLWSVPLLLMLIHDRPVQRPPRSTRTRERMAERLENYRPPGLDGRVPE